MKVGSSRQPPRATWHRLYTTARWRKLREYHLSVEPLCRFCLEREIVEPATVVDHIVPQKGDVELFHDPDNLSSLCKHCHDSTKQRMELGQEVVTFGADGWPRGVTEKS